MPATPRKSRVTRDDLDQLPDEVRELVEPHVITPEDLDTISKALVSLRDEAKAAREASGIEATWSDCEEAYIGIDKANRGEWARAKWTKPMSIDGPVTTSESATQENNQSTVFVRMTARYVDAGAAKLGEILLSSDDKSFSFSEMPVPELVRAKEDKSHVVMDHVEGMPATRPAKPHEHAQLANQGKVLPFSPSMRQVVDGVPAQGAPTVPATVSDFAEEKIEIARKAAKKAEKRVFDWLTKCNYPAEARKIIFDSSRIGVGVMKGPFPKVYRDTVVSRSPGKGVDVQLVERIHPAAKWVNPWNIFPDPACGERLSDGEYIFELDFITSKQLRDLESIPGYIKDQIRKAIALGPQKAADKNSKSTDAIGGRETRYPVWYFHGEMKRSSIESLYAAANKELDDLDAEVETVPAIVTMVGDVVVRATLSPLDSGAIPYHNVPWQRRPGYWAGIGPGEQLRTPQRMVNAATRATLNNAGVSAGPQVIINERIVTPADAEWAITPNKLWYANPESADDGDVTKAFTIAEIPNTTEELMLIVNYAMKLAEESTSIPLITEGQSGETTPETYGASALQDTNANQLLRSIGYSYDDNLTEPMTKQFYEWLLRDPEVPDDEKGEFQINAHGSSALVERAIMNQQIGQWGTLALNPAYGVDPKRWAVQYMKAQRIDPRDMSYSPEEMQRLAQTPQPKAPQVQAAEIRLAGQREQVKAKTQTDQLDLKHRERETATDATLELHRMREAKDNLMLEYALKRGITLDQVKGELARSAMQLSTEERLNAQNNDHDRYKHENPSPVPPVQAPGRAAPGHAFDQSIG